MPALKLNIAYYHDQGKERHLGRSKVKQLRVRSVEREFCKPATGLNPSTIRSQYSNTSTVNRHFPLFPPTAEGFFTCFDLNTGNLSLYLKFDDFVRVALASPEKAGTLMCCILCMGE